MPDFSGSFNQKFNLPAGSVTPGSLINYAINFQNTGGTAFGVSVEDVLDPSLDWAAFSSVPAPFATVDPAGRVVWRYGQVPSGTGGTISVSVAVRADACHGSVVRNAASILVLGKPVATLGPVFNGVAIGTVLTVSHRDPGEHESAACLAANGERGRPLLVIRIENSVQPGARGAVLRGLSATVAGSGREMIAPASAFAAVSVLSSAGAVLGTACPLSAAPEPVAVRFASPVPLAVGAAVEFTVVADITSRPAVGEVSAGLAAAADLDAIDAVAPCGIAVRPANADRFPMWGRALHLVSDGWVGSLRLVPNPFDPAVGRVSVSYFLERESRVTVAVFTQRGERVRTLVSDERHPAGLVCAETWDGKNGEGRPVRTGVYVVVVRARPAEGGAEARQWVHLAVLR